MSDRFRSKMGRIRAPESGASPFTTARTRSGMLGRDDQRHLSAQGVADVDGWLSPTRRSRNPTVSAA